MSAVLQKYELFRELGYGGSHDLLESALEDTGLNGDAQRIEQLGWMLFLKIFSDKDKEREILLDTEEKRIVID